MNLYVRHFAHRAKLATETTHTLKTNSEKTEPARPKNNSQNESKNRILRGLNRRSRDLESGVLTNRPRRRTVLGMTPSCHPSPTTSCDIYIPISTSLDEALAPKSKH